MSPHMDARYPNLWRALIVFCLVVVTAFAIVITFYIRAATTNARDLELCRAIVAYVAAGPTPSELRPGEYGYSYARKHPAEVRNLEERHMPDLGQALGCPTERKP